MQAIVWLHCLVAICKPIALVGNTAVLPYDAALAALLLDRRLVKTKGSRLTSFIGGGVLAFLPDASLFPDSTVLDAVPPDTLETFTSLIRHALGPARRRFKLLFRSTRDGATAAAFHSCCDAQGPTLTLIRDTAGNVFGGYTQKNWRCTNIYLGKGVSDPAAFLISIVSPHGTPPVLFPSTGSWASIVCDASYGPWFGAGIGVSGAFDDKCWSGVAGFQYVNPTGRPANEVMTGRKHFKPVVVEVYRL